MIRFLIQQLNKFDSREQAAGSKRREGGYRLVIVTILVFSLVSNYLLGQKEVEPEPVQLSYFIEPVEREMTAAEALHKLHAGEFKNYTGATESLDLGYMREGVWVLMKFRNNPDSADERFTLQLRHAYISGSFTPLIGLHQTFKLGETKYFVDKLLPRTQGFSDIRFVSFPLVVPVGGEFHALIRLRAHSMSVPFFILPETDFLSSTVREMVIIASFFGGLMLLAFYNLMVGIARREVEFVFYGFYVLCIGLMIVALNGSGHLFIWPNMTWLHLNCSNLLINFCCIYYLAFTLTLFREAPLRGFEYLIWNVLLLGCLVNFLLQLTEGGFYASVGVNLAALMTLLLSLVRAWRVRPFYGRLANLFLISEGVLFLGAFIYCVKMFGWLSSTHFTINIITVAATMEGILLSFVLSEKMRRTMIEKESALDRLATAQKHLAASVRDKTLALAARYTAHEVLNPVFALRLKAERIRDEIEFGSTPQQLRQFPPAHQVLQKTREMFHLIDSIIHTIRAIKTLSNDGLREKVVDVSLQSAFDDALRMLEAKTIHVQAKIVARFSAASQVRARRSDVVQVLMNLISNSLDALSGEKDRWIQVSDRVIAPDSPQERLMLEISVVDSGPGPEADIQEKLFDEEISTKDAGNGMGLGLAFCRKLMNRNGGIIAFDSSSPNTRFFFQLPVPDSQQQTSFPPEPTQAA